MLSLLREKIGVQSRVLSEHHEVDIEACETAEPSPPDYSLHPEDGCTTPRGQIANAEPCEGDYSTPPCATSRTNMGLTDSPKSPWNGLSLGTPHTHRSAAGSTPPPRQRASVVPATPEKRIATSAVRILDAPKIRQSYNQLLDSSGCYLAVPLEEVVYVRNSTTGDVQEACRMPEPVTSLRFCPKSSRLAVAHGRCVRTVDITRSDLHGTLDTCHESITRMSHSGSLLATGHSTGHYSLFDVRAQRRMDTSVHRAHYGGLPSLSWSPDRQYLATCGADGGVMVWCLRQRRALWTFRQEGPVYDVAWSHQSCNHLATVGGPLGSTVTTYNTLPGRNVHSTLLGCTATAVLWETDTLITSHGGACESSANPAPQGVVSSQSEIPHNSISLWKVGPNELVHQVSLTGHHEPIWNMTISSDKNHLVSAALDETVRFWELGATKTKQRRVRLSSVEAMMQIR
eukprot:TRINITY_DN74332_c0_g1_i1.p1 TRINITY_DN74332_c0_g1~~TRINITY_DN74332_c0_g1_i1.p1  ORF type:complete len:537 (+),score=114.45 TRINITY_DN74332_c0_g1_i1:243-1613(+)